MKLSSQIKSAVTKLANAQEADAFKGCGDPADYPIIEKRLKDAKLKLEILLKKVDCLEAYHEHAVSK